MNTENINRYVKYLNSNNYSIYSFISHVFLSFCLLPYSLSFRCWYRGHRSSEITPWKYRIWYENPHKSAEWLYAMKGIWELIEYGGRVREQERNKLIPIYRSTHIYIENVWTMFHIENQLRDGFEVRFSNVEAVVDSRYIRKFVRKKKNISFWSFKYKTTNPWLLMMSPIGDIYVCNINSF